MALPSDRATHEPSQSSLSRPSVSVPSAGALRKVASQIRHRLSDMESRSNVSWPASSPAAKTSGYVISEVADWQLRQWLHIIENVASAMSARSDETGMGSVRQDASAIPQGDAHLGTAGKGEAEG